MADTFDLCAWVRAIWSADSPLDKEGRAVMTVLCRRADAQGVAYPGMALICADSAVSRTKAFESLARLEALGWIERGKRPSGAGMEANLYRLPLRPPSASTAPRTSSPDESFAPRTSSPGGLSIGRGADGDRPWGGPEVSQYLPSELPIEDPTPSAGASTTTQKATPKPKPQKPPKAKAKPKRWTFVPDDWHPTEAHRAKARELGVSLDEQVALFRSHEFRTPKTDADRAFHGWLTRAASWAPARGGGSGAPRVQLSIKEGWRPTVLEFDDEGATP